MIDAQSSVSTYALIDKARLIITWGSSTSIEASFRNKPVIVLGANFYESFNAVYTVKSEKEYFPKKQTNIGIMQFNV